MPKNKFLSKRMCDIKSTCKEIGNQYIFLVTIIAAIIAQEIDDNDDLDNLAGFLIVLGEQLAFASSIRDTCEANAGEEKIRSKNESFINIYSQQFKQLFNIN